MGVLACRVKHHKVLVFQKFVMLKILGRAVLVSCGSCGL